MSADASNPLLKIDREDDGVVCLTLNDPQRRNAMTEAMGDALERATAELSQDASLRCVVLTGAPPAFSAGGDLDMLEELGRRTRDEGFDASETMRAFYRRFLALRGLPVPVIAAINGHAVGAGACVALACDLRIVAREAKFGLNFSRLGLHPGMGGTWLLPRAVGRQRAAEMLYTGRLASGEALANYGMALEALPSTEVLPAAMKLAASIAESSPVVVRQLKANLEGTGIEGPLDRSLEAQLVLEAQAQAVNYGTEDLVEGLAAVRARRAPKF